MVIKIYPEKPKSKRTKIAFFFFFFLKKKKNEKLKVQTPHRSSTDCKGSGSLRGYQTPGEHFIGMHTVTTREVCKQAHNHYPKPERKRDLPPHTPTPPH